MKRSKRFPVLFVLAVISVLLLAACGKKTPMPTPTAEPEAEAEPQPAATEEVEAESLDQELVEAVESGTYDLIVVNPNGEVGLLEDAFTATVDAPPVIDEVLPGEVENDAPETLAVTGSGFNTPTALWRCRGPDGAMTEMAGTVTVTEAVSRPSTPSPTT